MASEILACLSQRRMKATGVFVALCPKVLQQLHSAFLFLREAKGSSVSRQDIHVADFASTLANAPEVAQRAARTSAVVGTQSFGRSFETADIRAQGVNLARSRSLRRLLHELAQLARCFAAAISVQTHVKLPSENRCSAKESGRAAPAKTGAAG